MDGVTGGGVTTFGFDEAADGVVFHGADGGICGILCVCLGFVGGGGYLCGVVFDEEVNFVCAGGEDEEAEE